jgi:hypothetical protein
MTNTTKELRPDAGSDKAIEPSITSKTQPGIGVPPTTPEPDLESRIKVRRVELVARLRELRADARAEAGEAGDKLKAKLSEISHIIKEGVVDGWTALGDNVKQKLEHWLAESRQPPTKDGSTKAGQS